MRGDIVSSSRCPRCSVDGLGLRSRHGHGLGGELSAECRDIGWRRRWRWHILSSGSRVLDGLRLLKEGSRGEVLLNLVGWWRSCR